MMSPTVRCDRLGRYENVFGRSQHVLLFCTEMYERFRELRILMNEMDGETARRFCLVYSRIPVCRRMWEQKRDTLKETGIGLRSCQLFDLGSKRSKVGYL